MPNRPPLTGFLLSLAEDPQLHQDFVNDPTAVTNERLGGHPDLISVVLEGDAATIATKVQEEHAGAARPVQYPITIVGGNPIGENPVGEDPTIQFMICIC